MKDKRKGKLDRHFPILLNGHKVKILSYRIETKNGHELLTLKTLIRNPWISPRLVGQMCCISIGTEEPLQNLRCYCRTVFLNLSLHTYDFYIMREGEMISCGELISAKPVAHMENS